MRLFAVLSGLLLLATSGAASGATSTLALWASERPEDLRFAGSDTEIAAQAGFIVLTGEGVYFRRRRFPLRSGRAPTVIVAHVQIDHHLPLAWTPRQRSQAAAVVLSLARAPAMQWLQLDFEVRHSERPVLLDLLADVRRGLPRNVRLSMTALASWCETETWLAHAPVDEIVPMLFRMGPTGAMLKARIEAGGDFAEPRCRTAFAISTDTPLTRAPAGRRVYVFDPRSWTPADYAGVRQEVEGWASTGR